MNDKDNLIEWDDFNPNWNDYPNSEWETTNIKCPKCGERLHKNIARILLTNPAKSIYSCFECGWRGYK